MKNLFTGTLNSVEFRRGKNKLSDDCSHLILLYTPLVFNGLMICSKSIQYLGTFGELMAVGLVFSIFSWSSNGSINR